MIGGPKKRLSSFSLELVELKRACEDIGSAMVFL